MDVNVRCHTLCKDINLSKDQSTILGKRIRNNYYVHLYEMILVFLIELIIISSFFFLFKLVLLIIFHVQLNFKMSILEKSSTNMVID